MSAVREPCPGGFASAGPFAPRQGVDCRPAQVHAHPGLYSGPVSTGGHPSIWLVVAPAAPAVALLTILITRSRNAKRHG